MKIDDYYTVKNEAIYFYEEKKSKFIAYVFPVNCEEKALDKINYIKKKHRDASHNVYAYRIIENDITQRFSDDGEPSGTAGIPVLEAILKKDLYNVLVVVTRYFGGTLLGAGGLARAYGKSAAEGIEAGSITRSILCIKYIIATEYTFINKLLALLPERGFIIKNIQYADDVKISILVPISSLDNFIELINDVTSGKVSINEKGRVHAML